MNGVRKTIDMYGHNVSDSVYKPHVIDNIPDYGIADIWQIEPQTVVRPYGVKSQI